MTAVTRRSLATVATTATTATSVTAAAKRVAGVVNGTVVGGSSSVQPKGRLTRSEAARSGTVVEIPPSPKIKLAAKRNGTVPAPARLLSMRTSSSKTLKLAKQQKQQKQQQQIKVAESAETAESDESIEPLEQVQLSNSSTVASPVRREPGRRQKVAVVASSSKQRAVNTASSAVTINGRRGTATTTATSETGSQNERPSKRRKLDAGQAVLSVSDGRGNYSAAESAKKKRIRRTRAQIAADITQKRVQPPRRGHGLDMRLQEALAHIPSAGPRPLDNPYKNLRLTFASNIHTQQQQQHQQHHHHQQQHQYIHQTPPDLAQFRPNVVIPKLKRDAADDPDSMVYLGDGLAKYLSTLANQQQQSHQHRQHDTPVPSSTSSTHQHQHHHHHHHHHQALAIEDLSESVFAKMHSSNERAEKMARNRELELIAHANYQRQMLREQLKYLEINRRIPSGATASSNTTAAAIASAGSFAGSSRPGSPQPSAISPTTLPPLINQTAHMGLSSSIQHQPHSPPFSSKPISRTSSTASISASGTNAILAGLGLGATPPPSVVDSPLVNKRHLRNRVISTAVPPPPHTTSTSTASASASTPAYRPQHATIVPTTPSTHQQHLTPHMIRLKAHILDADPTLPMPRFKDEFSNATSLLLKQPDRQRTTDFDLSIQPGYRNQCAAITARYERLRRRSKRSTDEQPEQKQEQQDTEDEDDSSAGDDDSSDNDDSDKDQDAAPVTTPATSRVTRSSARLRKQP
ncbi:hypothetical protein GQ42DRAFT_9360 [Ramicandelaber brevisporus]|nr:hypothetical protein GQ42DRAFT_9360 [Ramicandelaber brevisporus]